MQNTFFYAFESCFAGAEQPNRGKTAA